MSKTTKSYPVVRKILLNETQDQAIEAYARRKDISCNQAVRELLDSAWRRRYGGRCGGRTGDDSGRGPGGIAGSVGTHRGNRRTGHNCRRTNVEPF
jgi:hypothetical protein